MQRTFQGFVAVIGTVRGDGSLLCVGKPVYNQTGKPGKPKDRVTYTLVYIVRGSANCCWKPLLPNVYRGVMARSLKSCVNATSAMLLSCPLLGCSRSVAPSFEIAGAYFPAWMFCALFGIVAAAGARAALVAGGLASVLPYQLFVCTSIGLIFALLLWLIQFG